MGKVDQVDGMRRSGGLDRFCTAFCLWNSLTGEVSRQEKCFQNSYLERYIISYGVRNLILRSHEGIHTTYLGPRKGKLVFGGLQTTKAQTSLRIRAVCSAPLLFANFKVSYLDLLRPKFQFSS